MPSHPNEVRRRFQQAFGWKRWAAGWLLTLLLLAAVAASSISCSDIATKPLAPVEISGTIGDRNGAPLQGATVGFFETQSRPYILLDGPSQPIATTDARGVYRITLPEGVYDVWIGGVADSGFLPVLVDQARLIPPRATLDYRYIGYRVSGRLLGPGGAALTAGDVKAYGERLITRSALRSGRYSLLLPAGTYALRAEPGFQYTGLPNVTYPGVRVASDTTIDLSVDGYAVTGTVFGPEGTAMDGAAVQASTGLAFSHALADGNGQYLLYAPAGEYTFQVYPPPYARYIASRGFSSVLVTSPKTLDFDLSGVEWTGTVRNAVTLDPVASVDISVWGYEPLTHVTSSASTLTDAVGSFRLVLWPHFLYSMTLIPTTPGFSLRFIDAVQAVRDSTLDLTVQPASP